MVQQGASDTNISLAAEFLTGKVMSTTYYEDLDIPLIRSSSADKQYKRITIPLPCTVNDIVKIKVEMYANLINDNGGIDSYGGNVIIVPNEVGIVLLGSTYKYEKYPVTWYSNSSKYNYPYDRGAVEFVMLDYNVFDAGSWINNTGWPYSIQNHYFKATYYYLADD